jgi:hypothetical protein
MDGGHDRGRRVRRHGAEIRDITGDRIYAALSLAAIS